MNSYTNAILLTSLGMCFLVQNASNHSLWFGVNAQVNAHASHSSLLLLLLVCELCMFHPRCASSSHLITVSLVWCCSSVRFALEMIFRLISNPKTANLIELTMRRTMAYRTEFRAYFTRTDTRLRSKKPRQHHGYMDNRMKFHRNGGEVWIGRKATAIACIRYCSIKRYHIMSVFLTETHRHQPRQVWKSDLLTGDTQ